jgi:hypothetical protein
MRNRHVQAFSSATVWAAILLAALSARSSAAEPAVTEAAAVEFFERKVRPVLAEHCYKCHSSQAKKLKGGLLLDSRATLLDGGDNGPAVVPGHPEKSRLVEAISYKNVDLRMPPKAKLPDAAIADLAAWVKMGVPWPREDTPKSPVASKATINLNQRRREHWAWQSIRPPAFPVVRDQSWLQTPIDRFILAKLEARGLAPAAPADKRTLIRRVTFDLTGLPPTPAEVDAFLADASPDALERVVDRLLASAHFGERWARHWLDLVRYAESRGHEYDYVNPDAYQYRDYVIRALNADVPYDQFVTEHIAGDLLDRPRLHPTAGFNESILGTGFWFLGEQLHSPVDIRQDEADRLDNMVDVAGKTFLGLTIACARCHDHKFDAISTRDYYALYGFLESSSYRLVPFDSLEQNRRVARELWQLRERSRPLLQRTLAESLRPAIPRLADYLLAAREAILLGPERQPGGSFSNGYRQRMEQIAQAHKLDAALLERWVVTMLAAARDASDPLHVLAKVVGDAGAAEPKRLAALLKPLIEDGRRRSAAAAALDGAEVVVDYRKPATGDWLPDGFAFGPGPVRPGQLWFAGDPARRVGKLLDYAAAEKDPTWDRLRPAPGTENDPGALGSAMRAGRTIRTPGFRVTAGKVFYLVKGTGMAYAAVDSHVMIAGPLHGQLVMPIKAGGDFQWIGHDLSPYKGQRAHIEFTATDRSDFAVALVVQSANAPATIDRPNQALLRILAGDDARSVETLARAHQWLLTDVVERLAADRIVGSAEAVDYARLANWLLGRPDLFASGDGGTDHRWTAAAGSFLADQAKLAAQIQSESRLALAILDGSGVDERVFIRGSHKAPGELVPRRFLEALAGPERLSIKQGSGRLELARQMTDPAINPFISRVMVNRVWHHLFGRGIVASVDNFGVLGEPPTHPELLDYLAYRFVQDGWSVKRLVRALVLSRAYQMSSWPDERPDQADPQNLLLHRMRVRRLEGEAIRDAMLVVSGRLDPCLYGPPVPVLLTDFQQGRGRPPTGPLDGDGRRSVYLAVRRNFLSSLLLAFDTPIPFSTVGRRSVSNVPAQALILMNDPFVYQQAEVWARRVLGQQGTARERITAMYLSAFARPPSESELTACVDFLSLQAQLASARRGPKSLEVDDPAVWADLAHVLFNAKEFIFVN